MFRKQKSIPHVVTVSVGYNTQSSRPLSEVIAYQIKQMKEAKEGLTTSVSLKVAQKPGEVIPTRLYGPVYYEYGVVDEKTDIHQGFIWEAERQKQAGVAATRVEKPLISIGDMESTYLDAKEQELHGVSFSVHKYHQKRPGKNSTPLSNEQILADMQGNLGELRKETLRRYNADEKNALNYSEIQIKIKPSLRQPIKRIVVDAENGHTRFPFDYLFQEGRHRTQLYKPTADDFNQLMMFQAVVAQYYFYQANINQDQKIIPLHRRIVKKGNKAVATLEEVSPETIVATLQALQSNQKLRDGLTKSSRQKKNLQEHFDKDIQILPQLIMFVKGQISANKKAAQPVPARPTKKDTQPLLQQPAPPPAMRWVPVAPPAAAIAAAAAPVAGNLSPLGQLLKDIEGYRAAYTNGGRSDHATKFDALINDLKNNPGHVFDIDSAKRVIQTAFDAEKTAYTSGFFKSMVRCCRPGGFEKAIAVEDERASFRYPHYLNKILKNKY